MRLIFALLTIISTISNTEEIKIALVKQVVYPDLYCCSTGTPIKKLIFSSLRRSGPVALFTKYNADFFIVSQEPNPECYIWTEKYKDLKMETEDFYTQLAISNQNMGNFVSNGSRKAQGEYAIKCDTINWGHYDIVIAIDIAIPARITKLYPYTLWVYCIGEASPTFYRSLEYCIEGYDCYITHSFYQSRPLKSHVIECPYHIQYYPCFHELLSLKPDDSAKRKGTLLEFYTNKFLSKEKKNVLTRHTPIFKSENEELKEYIDTLLSSKYLIICIEEDGHKPVLGNSIIEAISGGALVIATKKSIQNYDVLTEKTLVDSFEQVIEALQYFEQDPVAYQTEVSQQRKKQLAMP